MHREMRTANKHTAQSTEPPKPPPVYSLRSIRVGCSAVDISTALSSCMYIHILYDVCMCKLSERGYLSATDVDARGQCRCTTNCECARIISCRIRVQAPYAFSYYAENRTTLNEYTDTYAGTPARTPSRNNNHAHSL